MLLCCLLSWSGNVKGDVIYNSWNADPVSNNPSILPVFSITTPSRITEISNYHWNGGVGLDPVSIGATISIYDNNSNALIGSWPAAAQLPNTTTYWVAFPEIILQPGTYRIEDSSRSTWSAGLSDAFHSLGQTGANWGIGVGFSRVSATEVPGNGIRALAAGWTHSLFLKADGTAWACGDNRSGQFGDGTVLNRSIPVQVMSGVKAISAGGGQGSGLYSHSLFLKTDGSVWASGFNDFGELGDGTTTNRSSSVQVMTGIQAISAGATHSLFLKSNGSVWACGYNFYGQLGDGTTTNRSTPVQVMTGVQAIAAGYNHNLFLKTDGSVWACGENSTGKLGDGTTTTRNTPVQVMTGVQAISAGVDHSLFLKNDGSVWACGYNSYGQLGDGTTTNRKTPLQLLSGVQAISAGDSHSLFLKIDGSLWACGWNNVGQLGDGTTTNRSTPVQAMTGIQAISAGKSYSLFLKSDGSVRACGLNYDGQLGDGTSTVASIPVQALTGVQSISTGGSHSLYLKTNGSVWACGFNAYGQLGDGTSTDRSYPEQVLAGVQAIAAGYRHSLFLKTNGSVWACGNNTFGVLGDGTTTGRSTPVQVTTGVQAIAAGHLHNLFLKTDGSVWACGWNNAGQLGDGTTTNRSTPVLVMTGVQAISAGYNHSLFLKANGSVWACGSNSLGKLGDGTTTNRSTPIQVMSGIQAVSAGKNHTLFLKSDSSVWACGYNAYGQIGDGTTTNRPSPMQVMTGVSALTAGLDYSLFLKSDGGVLACGFNTYSQLGDGTSVSRSSPVQVLGSVQAVDAGEGHSLFLRTDGNAWASGASGFGLPPADKITPTQTLLGVSPPLTVVGAASELADRTATLNGSVDSQLSATTWQFEYGITTAYGQTTPLADNGSGFGAMPVSANLTGLNSNTLYHYRLKATNGNGTAYSEDFTFTTLNPPDIAMEAPNGSLLVSGTGLLDFVPAATGQSHDITVTVRNEGGVTLTALSASISTTDSEVSAFSWIGVLPSSLASGESVSCNLRFTPASIGVKTATLSISSNDPDENPFTVVLTGTGTESSSAEDWQQAQFGADANNPSIAGWNADPDNDGVPNLLERAFNLNPLASGNPVLSPDTGTSGLPAVSTTQGLSGPVLSIQYLRLKAFTNPGISYIPEYSSVLDDQAWSAASGTEAVESIDSNWERVTVTDSVISTPSTRFGRVRVVANQ